MPGGLSRPPAPSRPLGGSPVCPLLTARYVAKGTRDAHRAADQSTPGSTTGPTWSTWPFACSATSAGPRTSVRKRSTDSHRATFGTDRGRPRLADRRDQPALPRRGPFGLAIATSSRSAGLTPAERFDETGEAGSDPADRVTLDDGVRLALLVVLERLSPAERVSFVLHDIFGVPFRGRRRDSRSPREPRVASSARRARRKLEALGRRHGVRPSAPDEHRLVTDRFIAACANGETSRTSSLVLDPDVTGGVRTSARHLVVRGARFVSTNLLRYWERAESLVSLPFVDNPCLLAFVDRSTSPASSPSRSTMICVTEIVHVYAELRALGFLRARLGDKVETFRGHSAALAEALTPSRGDLSHFTPLPRRLCVVGNHPDPREETHPHDDREHRQSRSGRTNPRRPPDSRRPLPAPSRALSTLAFTAKKLRVFMHPGHHADWSQGPSRSPAHSSSTPPSTPSSRPTHTFTTPMRKAGRAGVGSAALLDVATYPRVEFDSTEIWPAPGGTWKCAGPARPVHGQVAPAALTVASASTPRVGWCGCGPRRSSAPASSASPQRAPLPARTVDHRDRGRRQSRALTQAEHPPPAISWLSPALVELVPRRPPDRRKPKLEYSSVVDVIGPHHRGASSPVTG